MNRRRIARELESSSWPAFDIAALSTQQREVFVARHKAIELYVANDTLASIEASTGVVPCQLYRLLNRCMAQHEDGRLFGWRALVPYARVADYQRLAKLQPNRAGAGAAGAFGVLLQSHPSLAAWITEQVRGKRIALDRISTDDRLRVRLRGLKHLHRAFLGQCRAVRLTAVDYPFNTENMGIRSLAAAVRAECLHGFGRGAHLAGAKHLKGMPADCKEAPPAGQALDVVEFDGHRLDVRLKVVVRDPLT